MDEEKITTEMTVEKPVNGARQELETLLNENLPEEKRRGDVDQMALDYIKELREQNEYIKELKEMNDRLVEAISNNPQFAQALADMVNGKGGAASLVRHFGKDFFDVEEGSPEYEEMMAAEREFMDERARMENARVESENKLNEWFEFFRNRCEERKLNPDVYLTKVDKMLIEPMFDLEKSEEFCDMLINAVDYKKDVDDAFEAGELKARNMNINEMRSKPSDGMPSGLSSQAPVVERPKRAVNPLIARALNA